MVTLIHEWLRTYGGAERVLAQFISMYPQAKILVGYGARNGSFGGAPVEYMRLNHLYLEHAPFQPYRVLSPLAFRLSSQVGDDLVISNGHSGSLWSRVRAGVPWIHYCHTPARFLWRPDLLVDDRKSHFRTRRPGLRLVQYLDSRRGRNPTLMVANSRNIQQRIRGCYRRDASIVYPPVMTEFFRKSSTDTNQGYFLIVGRLENYRRIWHVLDAFSSSNLELRVVGCGSAMPNMRRRFESGLIRFMGRVSDIDLRKLYSEAIAHIIPGEEDFCMTAVEAMACGSPIIAFKKGGALETVIEGETGIFLEDLSRDSIIRSCRTLIRMRWNCDIIRKRSEMFSELSFQRRFSKIIDVARWASE